MPRRPAADAFGPLPPGARCRKPRVTEAQVLKACLALLELRGVPAWRNNTGATRIGGRFIRFGIPGSSDILGVVPFPGGYFGRFLAIECKRPGEKVTPDQAAFLGKIGASGGISIIVDDVGVLGKFLDQIERSGRLDV